MPFLYGLERINSMVGTRPILKDERLLVNIKIYDQTVISKDRI
ncbi:hypothetical protein [Desulfitobacterium sp.]|nr:hypothetical protein [Desulfitobacterium sp.]